MRSNFLAVQLKASLRYKKTFKRWHLKYRSLTKLESFLYRRYSGLKNLRISRGKKLQKLLFFSYKVGLRAVSSPNLSQQVWKWQNYRMREGRKRGRVKKFMRIQIKRRSFWRKRYPKGVRSRLRVNNRYHFHRIARSLLFRTHNKFFFEHLSDIFFWRNFTQRRVASSCSVLPLFFFKKPEVRGSPLVFSSSFLNGPLLVCTKIQLGAFLKKGFYL